MNYKKKLLDAWKKFDASKEPLVLEEDKEIICCEGSNTFNSGFQGYIEQPDFGKEPPGRFHLGLLPLPFAGNLKQAKVFILMLNPGFNPSDYLADVQENYRSEIIKIYRQENDAKCIFFDPNFSWHGGFTYWHKKLSKAVDSYSQKNHISRLGALHYFTKKICFMEAFPYHSMSFKMTENLETLPSKKLIEEYVKKELVPRAEKNEILIIVPRANGYWNLNAGNSIIINKGAHTRSGYISEDTQVKIADFIGR